MDTTANDGYVVSQANWQGRPVGATAEDTLIGACASIFFTKITPF